MSETTVPTRTRRLAYIGALDGVRALSVLAVMAYHAGVARVPGGFLGVDVFFVLSGYLITSLLLREELDTATLAVLQFWGRRVRRLAPALLMVLVATSIFVAYVATPGLFPSLRGDAWSAVGYVLNWRLVAAKSTYWLKGLPGSPLTHLWSLAIEEQFYLLWPLMVWGLFRFGRGVRAVGALSLGGALASASWMAWLFAHHANTTRLYYGTDTHVAGLLLGAALGCVLIQSTHAVSSRVRNAVTIAAWIGAGLLTLSCLKATGSSHWLYQGGFFLVALAVLPILADVALSPRRVLARILSFGPLRYVGRISYGLYLWHYPIFLWCNAERTSLHGASLLVARFVITFLVATASYYLVEKPIRFGVAARRWTPKALWVGAMGATLVVVSVLASVAAVPSAPKPPAPVMLHHPLKVLIVGDSVAFSLVWWGGPWSELDNVAVTSGAIAGCGLMPFVWGLHHGSELHAAHLCRHAPSSAKGYLTFWTTLLAKQHPDVVVILAGRWEEHTLFRHGYLTSIEDPAFRRELNNRMLEATRVASSTGARVVWSTSPCSNSGESLDGSPWIEDNPHRLALYNGLVHRVARAEGDPVFELNALLCPAGRYERVIDGTVIRSADGVHFAPSGAPWVMRRLDRFLLRVTHWPTSAT